MPYKEFDPNDAGVIDQVLNGIYESEAMNYHAHGWGLKVVHEFFGDFSDEWYTDWIGTEDFRSGLWPDGRPIDEDNMRRYEKMYDLYWDARSEWFNTIIANINMQNLREANRAMYLHTMTSPLSWEEYGREAKRVNPPLLKHYDNTNKEH